MSVFHYLSKSLQIGYLVSKLVINNVFDWCLTRFLTFIVKNIIHYWICCHCSPYSSEPSSSYRRVSVHPDSHGWSKASQMSWIGTATELFVVWFIGHLHPVVTTGRVIFNIKTCKCQLNYISSGSFQNPFLKSIFFHEHITALLNHQSIYWLPVHNHFHSLRGYLGTLQFLLYRLFDWTILLY